MAHYLDTSAVAKLVVAEPESGALRRWISRSPSRPTSSDLTRTELLRAVRGVAASHTDRALAVLETLHLQSIGRDIFAAAGQLEPLPLRSLDAIHLACALNLGSELESFVTYDARLAEAARAYNMVVTAPA